MEIEVNLPYFIGFIIVAWLPWVWLLMSQDFVNKNKRFFIAVLLSMPSMSGMFWAIGATGYWLIGGSLLFFILGTYNLCIISYCARCGKQDVAFKIDKRGYLCDYCRTAPDKS